MFLTNFNSSVEFAICSEIASCEGPYHIKSSPPIYNVNPLLQYYIVEDLSGGYSQTDCKVNFNTNVKATVDSYMNRSFNYCFSRFPLIVALVFLNVKIRKALRCNIVSSKDLLKLNNLCHLIRKFTNFSQIYLSLVNFFLCSYETRVCFLILLCIIYASYSNSNSFLSV